MNNERYNQIIDEAYENYKRITNNFQLENPIDDFIIKTLKGEMIKIETEDGDDYRILSQEEFINKCKTDTEFSERWELKIEEIKLNIEERNKWSWDNWGITCEMESVLDDEGVPSKLIIVTYKDEKTEIYE